MSLKGLIGGDVEGSGLSIILGRVLVFDWVTTR